MSMKIKYVKNASIVVESGGCKVLTDPWLTDGEYYGSWYHYPPADVDIQDFNDVDYIYISHIHPDHSSAETLQKLNTDIPILIHDFQFDFLKHKLEAFGFDVTEIPHNQPVPLENNLKINILAADNCNPELCGKFIGCEWVGEPNSSSGGTSIDTLAVFSDSKSNMVHINDCPYELARHPLKLVLEQYDSIDYAMVPYAGAGPYPQCMTNLTDEEKKEAAQEKKLQFLNQGLNYIKLLQPDYYTPFAGTYVLGAEFFDLNEYRGVPLRKEARDYFRESLPSSNRSKGILYNSGDIFDVDRGVTSSSYNPVIREELSNYTNEVLSEKKLTYAEDPMPSRTEIEELIPGAYESMEKTRSDLGFKTDTDVYLKLPEEGNVKISMKGSGFEYVREGTPSPESGYVQFSVDFRLLKKLLQGPPNAHWNNAEIGSHIRYERQPKKFERGIYYCMNFFHN